MPPLPPRIQRLAEHQFGAVSRQQLLTAGLGAGQVDGLVRRGDLVSLRWGVYRVAGGAVPAEQEPMAAVLRTRGSRVTGPFVAALFGAEGFSRDDPFVLCTPTGRRPRSTAFPVRVDPVPGGHAAMWGGLPITTPTVAAIDLAHPSRGVSDRALRTAVDTLRWGGHTSTERLSACARELVRDPGARRIRRLLGDGSLVAESGGERRLGAVVDQISPAPRRQVEVLSYRLDYLWPSVRLDLEYDGEVHARPDRRARDRRRDAALTEAGYEVLRVRATDLRAPESLRARILDVLRTRARQHDLDPATFR